MNVPRNETRGAPCKLQCSAIRLNGNKAIACVNFRTIPIENYETRKIKQPEIFARTKVSFFYSWLDKKNKFSFFYSWFDKSFFQVVGQKTERKLLLTQETLLFWIADTKLPLLKYSKAIAPTKHS